MAYTPTAADYEYILQNDPYAFADLGAARNVLSNIRSTPNTDVESRLAALNTNYTRGGNPPMTASPRGGPGADPKFGMACVDCKPNEPCCLKSGVLHDAKDPTRKLVWPVAGENPKKRILVIAKDIDGDAIVGKLKLKGEGSACRSARQNLPGFFATSPRFPGITLDMRESDLTVGFPVTFGSSLALANLVPPKVLYALMVFDLIMSSQAITSGRQPMRVSPKQCMDDGSMTQSFQIAPVPYFKLEASATAEVGLHFMTTGIGGSAGIKGNITGKYANIDIGRDAAATARSTTGQREPAEGDAPGFLGILASITKRMSEYVKKGTDDARYRPGIGDAVRQAGSGVAGTKPEEIDITDFGSGVHLDKTLKLTATGIELKAKSGTPDLEATIGTFELSLTLQIKGIIDFIDIAVVALLSPASARLVKEARTKAADSSNAVRAEARCDVTLSATGELKHTTESGLRVLIPAEGDSGFDRDKLNKEFGGKVTVLGRAQILIHAEAEVWFVSAQAGASGQMHTGWTWELKVDGERKRKKRYYFDGLVARAVGYARANVTSTHKRSSSTRRGPDAKTSGSLSGTQSGPEIAAGDKDYRDLTKGTNPTGSRYVILAPTVEKVTDNAPAWQDY